MCFSLGVWARGKLGHVVARLAMWLSVFTGRGNGLVLVADVKTKLGSLLLGWESGEVILGKALIYISPSTLSNS